MTFGIRFWAAMLAPQATTMLAELTHSLGEFESKARMLNSDGGCDYRTILVRGVELSACVCVRVRLGRCGGRYGALSGACVLSQELCSCLA
eukprot:6202249-Pleurochrysis_carterae.AAC.1